MSVKRVALTILCLCAVVLTAGAATPAQAGTAAPYSGRLTDPNGQPVADGVYEFTFALYDAAEGGSPIWTETQSGVLVRGGAFSTQLGSASPLPSAARQGTHYLAVSVRGPGEAAFTALAPRQAWAAPAATGGCPHTHFGEEWIGTTANLGSGLHVTNNAMFGSGLSGEARHGVEGFTSMDIGVGGYFANKSSTGGIAVHGLSEATSGDGIGVQGESASWIGVYGLNTSTDPAVEHLGVAGEIHSTNGYGVQGFSTNTAGGVGVRGLAYGSGTGAVGTSDGGTGVYGTSTTGTAVFGYSTGGQRGVYGQSDKTDGVGVWGYAANGEAVGVFGDSPNIGVQGNASDAYGVGVLGLADAAGCSGGAFGSCSGVGGHSSSGNGIDGRSETGIGVYAGATGNGVALYAESAGSGNLIEAYIGPVMQNRRFYVANNGNVYADGTYSSPAADLAEMLPAVDKLEPGDVLAVGLDGKLARSTQPYQSSIVGVYSTKPGFVGGAEDGVDLTGKVPLAVVGLVPVKVTAENGPILPGDLLVASSTPGHAMKAGPNPPVGTVIGKALGALQSGTGVIQMLVTLQ